MKKYSSLPQSLFSVVIAIAAMNVTVSGAYAMDTEKTHLTTENSTTKYYELADTAARQLMTNYNNYDQNTMVSTLFKPNDNQHSPTDAQNRVRRAYTHNILDKKLHPGIPEGKWDENGNGGERKTTKFGNQELIHAIHALYAQKTDLNGVVLKDLATTDPIAQPLIEYDSGFTPKPASTMTQDELNYVNQLKSKFIQDYPASNNTCAQQ